MRRLVAFAALGIMLGAGCSKASDSAHTNATSASRPDVVADTVAAAGDPAAGAKIFVANCASCHGAAGVGGGVGPLLKDERDRKSTSAAIAWIKNPQPPMPALYPSILSEKDVADVAAYVESL